MILYTERYQVYEAQKFNKLMTRFLINLLEIPFISIVNEYYEINLEMPKLYYIKKELKDIGSLKYVTKEFPESIRTIINQSEELKNYYSNSLKEFNQTIKQFKEANKK